MLEPPALADAVSQPAAVAGSHENLFLLIGDGDVFPGVSRVDIGCKSGEIHLIELTQGVQDHPAVDGGAAFCTRSGDRMSDSFTDGAVGDFVEVCEVGNVDIL